MPLGSRIGLGVVEEHRPLREHEFGGKMEVSRDGTREPGANAEGGVASDRGAKWEEEEEEAAGGLDTREE